MKEFPPVKQLLEADRKRILVMGGWVEEWGTGGG